MFIILETNMRGLVLCLLCVVLGVSAVCRNEVYYSMIDEKIVPDVIFIAPTKPLLVSYSSGVKADFGNELTPTQVKDQPLVSWEHDPNSYYTLALVDPDVPSRDAPKTGDHEFRHWLIGNIPGKNLNMGEALTEYIGSATPKNTGLHRYVFLMFRQPSKLDFRDEPRVSNRCIKNRFNFSIQKFAIKYNLGAPVAGNFYKAQYDDFVPVIMEQLGANNLDKAC